MSACRRHYPGRTDGTDSLVAFHPHRPSPDYRWVGSCIISFEACSAFTHVTTCRLTKSPYATLSTGGFSGFVASTAAPIATGRSDPVPGRVYPRCGPAPFTAHCNRPVYDSHLETPTSSVYSAVRCLGSRYPTLRLAAFCSEIRELLLKTHSVFGERGE
jgi:hypothetical protein